MISNQNILRSIALAANAIGTDYNRAFNGKGTLDTSKWCFALCLSFVVWMGGTKSNFLYLDFTSLIVEKCALPTFHFGVTEELNPEFSSSESNLFTVLRSKVELVRRSTADASRTITIFRETTMSS